MQISEVVEAARKLRGISYAELARRTQMNYDVLQRFLTGQGGIKGIYLVRLCMELGLEIQDFAQCLDSDLINSAGKL